MMTTPPIPTSIADACAAHDRHRLDVLDALLDEAAPTAVRELLGAALDLCATLRTERDEREEAIGATFAKHRAEIDAATAQLAAARQVIDEERATVARQTARVASLESERTEWIAAAVDVGAALGGSLGPVAGTSGTIDPREWIRYAQGLARDVRKLTDRVAELEARPVMTEESLSKALGWTRHIPKSVSDETASDVLRHLGPVTLPAQDRAKELIRSILSERKSMMSGLGASLDDKPSDTWASEWINATRSSLASLGAPATTPTAAPGLVAAVSVEELACAWFNACEPGGTVPADIDDFDRARVRAVLARLDATTIAPVNPEAVARAYHDHEDAPTPEWEEVNIWRGRDQDEQRAAISAMRATLTAAGIPVTPEERK